MASEDHLKMLHQILQMEGNGICVDCGAKDPEWASINLGVFICIECSGFHRNMGTHISKVRSLRLDIWTNDLIEFMRSNGNIKSNLIYEHSVPIWYPRIKDGDATIMREQWIRAKYERKEFVKDAPKAFNITNPQSVIKEGQIFKKGKENTKWLPRLFVLKDKIYYYKKENDPKDFLGTIELKQLKVCFASQKTMKPFCIQLIDGSDNRSYYLHTETGKELVSWYSAIIIAKSLSLGIDLNSFNSHEKLMETLDILIIHEGSMSKKSGGKNTLNKRWCMMDSKYMYFYKDSTSAFPMEKIALSSYSQGSQVLEGEEGYQLILQTHETKECLECDSKVDKTKWFSSIDSVIKRLSEKKKE